MVLARLSGDGDSEYFFLDPRTVNGLLLGGFDIYYDIDDEILEFSLGGI